MRAVAGGTMLVLGLGAAACLPSGVGNATTADGRSTGQALPGGAYVRKIDSHLQEILAVRAQGGDVMAAAEAAGLRMNDAGEVLVDVLVSGSTAEAARQLTSMGMRVAAVDQGAGLVEGFLLLGRVESVAELDFVRFIQALYGPGRNRGSP